MRDPERLRTPLVTAFATGSSLVVLPMLAEICKDLIAESRPDGPLGPIEEDQEEAESSVDVLIPTFFSFPTIGKVLSLTFVLFAGWYIGAPIATQAVVMVPLESTASEAMEAIKHAFELQGTAGTVFVVEADRKLVGIFRPRDLMVAAPDTPLRDIMLTDFPVVRADARQDEAAHVTEGEGYMSLPVVDGEGRLLGRITPKLRERILAEEQSKDLLRMSHVSPDARATDGYLQIVRGRLTWLLAGLIGATIAAFIIGSFEEELEKAAILAAFIPVVMSMAGNSGLQASGVSVQVLASGSMWPGDKLATRLLRELAGALSNGAVAGIILALLVMVMSGLFDIENAGRLALATSFSLMTVTTIAALVGASVPFGLHRFGIDPAAATGVFITTSNDVLGVLVYFTMADLFYF